MTADGSVAGLSDALQAALFPQGKTAVHARCNAGERKLFEALKRHLPDDHIVRHDLPIGDAGLQPDFVILSPRQGLFVLENGADWQSTAGRRCSI